jgi:hypothetical protein
MSTNADDIDTNIDIAAAGFTPFNYPQEDTILPPSNFPVQLSITFPQPSVPVEVSLALQGSFVALSIKKGELTPTLIYFRDAGIHISKKINNSLLFPLEDLLQLRNLSSYVTIETHQVDTALATLVDYALSNVDFPATLTVADTDKLYLSWNFENKLIRKILPSVAVPVLIASQLPFVATEKAWEHVTRLSGLASSLGQAQLNLDGYIEISTAHPQHLESAPLPGLFRIDDTHFGISRAYSSALAALSAIVWSGPKLRYFAPPVLPVEVINILSSHLQLDLQELLSRLATLGGQILVYSPGLGRRVLALGALVSLKSFPGLVVSPPWSLWVWQRNADLFSKTTSLSSDSADIRLVTYLDLTLGIRLDAYETIVFDDLDSTDARLPQARAAMAGLSVMDAYRIGICDEWPQDPEYACGLLEAVRPGEFSLGDQPLGYRYPRQPVLQAQQHAQPYLLFRQGDSTLNNRAENIRRSEVVLVEPSREQVECYKHLIGKTGKQHVLKAIEISSYGTPEQVSPKIGAATRLAQEAVTQKHSIILVTAFTPTANILRDTLANFSPILVDDITVKEVFKTSPSPSSVVICLTSWTASDLRSFDEVIFIDYPWSTTSIELAVGSAAAEWGPRQVTILHSPNLIDDRLAVYAARRRELSPILIDSNPAKPPTNADCTYLLAQRW